MTEQATQPRSSRELAPTPPGWLIALAGLIVVAATIATAVVTDKIHAPFLPHLAKMDWHIVTGHALWRVFQSRVLVPYFVLLVAKARAESYYSAYVQVTHLLTAVMSTAGVLVFWRLSRNLSTTVLYTLLMLGMFCGLQLPMSLAGWDYVNVVVFLVFSYGIVKRKNLSFFTGLFAVAVLNHEVALLIPTYLICRSVTWNASQRRPAVTHRRDLIYGGVLLIAGFIWTELIRHLLFHGSSFTLLGADSSHYWFGNHYTLDDNLRAIFQPTGGVRPILMMLYVAATVTYAYPRISMDARLLLFMTLLLTAVTVVFAFVSEIRVWLPIVPCLLVAYLSTKSGVALRAPEVDAG